MRRLLQFALHFVLCIAFTVGLLTMLAPRTRAQTWTLIQHKPLQSTSCGTALTCTISLNQAIGSGHLVVLQSEIFNTNNSAVLAYSSSAAGTDTLLNYAPSNRGFTSGSFRGTTFITYQLSTSAGGTSASMTVTGTIGANSTWGMEFSEWAYTGTTPTVDTGNTVTATACSSCLGVPLTLGGTDLVLQTAFGWNQNTGLTGAGGATLLDLDTVFQNAYGYAANVGPGSMPNSDWTWTGNAAGPFIGAAIAFKASSQSISESETENLPAILDTVSTVWANKNPTVTETHTTTAAVAAVHNSFGSVSETVSESDNAVVIRCGGPVEVLPHSDSVTTLHNIRICCIAETHVSVDTVTGIVTHAKSLTETNTTADVVMLQHLAVLNPAENHTTAPAVVTQRATAASPSVSNTTTDSSTGVGAHFANESESKSTSDSVAASHSTPSTAALGETLTTADSVTAFAHHSPNPTETLVTADSVSRVYAAQICCAAESNFVDDEVLAARETFATLLELNTTVDAVNTQSALLKSASESNVTSDAAAGNTSLNVALSFSSSAVDNISISAHIANQAVGLSENLSTADSLGISYIIHGHHSISLSEQLGTNDNDAISITSPLQISLVESFTTVDTVINFVPNHSVVSETVKESDSINVFKRVFGAPRRFIVVVTQ